MPSQNLKNRNKVRRTVQEFVQPGPLTPTYERGDFGPGDRIIFVDQPVNFRRPGELVLQGPQTEAAEADKKRHATGENTWRGGEIVIVHRGGKPVKVQQPGGVNPFIEQRF